MVNSPKATTMGFLVPLLLSALIVTASAQEHPEDFHTAKKPLAELHADTHTTFGPTQTLSMRPTRTWPTVRLRCRGTGNRMCAFNSSSRSMPRKLCRDGDEGKGRGWKGAGPSTVLPR